ncbi:MAG: preprotein translocase subunit YajC [Acidobacteriota bacterium]|nr:preprotein translocase subunit YajC [Acidobacteriota bacterium]MDH3528846.1 preprotein translocase subunit YajC [Acidobacteriota bacterium]
MNTFLILFQGGGAGLIWTILPFLLIFGIFYFLVILPQRKQQAQLKEMIASLKNGDEIVTNGGLIGKIIEVKDSSFIIRSAGKSNLEIGKSAIVGRKPGAEEK